MTLLARRRVFGRVNYTRTFHHPADKVGAPSSFKAHRNGRAEYQSAMYIDGRTLLSMCLSAMSTFLEKEITV